MDHLDAFRRFGKNAQKDGKGFALIGGGGVVADVLKVSRLDMVVPVFTSCEELE